MTQILFRSHVLAHLAGCFVVGLLLWLVTIYAIRYTLKLLLMYKGWIYEARGPGSQISTTTKLWGMAVKLFSGWHKPMLYSFQGSLPRLPLPSVQDTTRRVIDQLLSLSTFVFMIERRFSSPSSNYFLRAIRKDSSKHAFAFVSKHYCSVKVIL